MKFSFPVDELIATYNADHQHPMNRLCHSIGIPLILVSLVWVFFAPFTGLALFVAGWIFQFAGHKIEGKKPSFANDPRMLLVGPIYFGRKLYRLISTSRRTS